MGHGVERMAGHEICFSQIEMNVVGIRIELLGDQQFFDCRPEFANVEEVIAKISVKHPASWIFLDRGGVESDCVFVDGSLLVSEPGVEGDEEDCHCDR